MTPEHKKWIDAAAYETLLERWRNSPAGDPIFRDEAGEYFSKVLREKKESVGHEVAVAASKRIGWEGRP